MKKSTKIITTAVALALVVAAMVVGIYAATSASATITASVNWSATAGITFTLDGTVKSYGSASDASPTTKSITQQVVTASTTNTNAAALAGNLDANFVDESTDGVNNPGKVEFTYTIANTGTKAITVKMTKYPAPASESNTNSVHKPAVAMTLKNGSTTVNYSEATVKTNGVSVAANTSYVITITLTMASGGTGSINADTNLSSFDAGVTFALS